MKTEFRFWLALLVATALFTTAPPSRAGSDDLPLASDLRSSAAQAAKAGGPLIVIFSRHDCKYCETVKRDYLKPLANHPKYRDRLLVLQVNQDSEVAITDFHGNRTSHARFATSEKIKLVPVVAFFGPDGQILAEPIVGARLPDFYQGYLESAIEKSIVALKRR